MLRCVTCDGKGCDTCEGRGYLGIDGCPYAAVSEDVDEMMVVAQLFKQGITPVAGGYLDQPTKVIDACQLIWAELSAWEIHALKGK